MELFGFFLPAPINQSVQVGDVAYYTKNWGSTFGGFNVNDPSFGIQQIGVITNIKGLDTTGDGVTDHYQITCEISLAATPPNTGDFIFFSKNKKVEESGLMGYYGEFTFSNDSSSPAELFMTGVEVTASS